MSLQRRKIRQLAAPYRCPGNPYDGHMMVSLLPAIEQQIGTSFALRVTVALGLSGQHQRPASLFSVQTAATV
jgi:hypothetical protein